MFIVFDLDDTLADTTHRQWILDGRDKSDPATWDTFFGQCYWDSPKQEIIAIFEAFAASEIFEHRIEIWTGRSKLVENKTRAWLNKYVGWSEKYALRMREEGDYRHDTEIKGEWIEKHGKPDLVFDDRNKTVQWWRDQGVVCCQVKESDF